MSQISFDARTVTPSVGFSVAPAGRYQVILTKCQIEPTEKGDGEKIVCVAVAQGGNNHGQVIGFNINWVNPSEQAVKIGKGQFSALCFATGVIVPEDTAQLLNKPFMLEVSVTPDGKWNQLVAIDPLDGAAPAVNTAPAIMPQAASTPPPPPIVQAPPPPPAWPPKGWKANPAGVGWYYEEANPNNQLQEAQLKALFTPVVTNAPPPPPVAGGEEVPGWLANQLAAQAQGNG